MKKFEELKNEFYETLNVEVPIEYRAGQMKELVRIYEEIYKM